MLRFLVAILLLFASAGSGQAALIGHWTLDSTLVDAAGANDLTYGGGGTPSYVVGEVGNAGALGGSNWYDTGVTEIGSTSLFAEAAQSWSVSAWFNVTNGNEGTIVGKAGETERTLQIFLQGGTINTHIRGGVSETVATFDDGQWHHVVVTWNGSAGVLYIDNAVSIASLTIGNNAEQTTENIIIGGRTGGTGFLLTGSIDDVQIFNHALNAGEVDELFDPSEPPPPSGDFDIAVTREPIRSGTGTQDFEFANFDQDCTSVPCLVMFILTSAITDGTAASHANIGVGFTNGTNETAISVYAEDGAATTDTDRANRDNGEAIFLYTSGAVNGVADFSSWLSNGIQINVTDAFTAQYLVTAVIFGGSDFQSAMGDAALGTVDTVEDVNTVGFEPDLVFLFGTRISSAGDLDGVDQFFSFGFAVNDGASTQGGIACDAADGVADSASWVVASSQYALPSTGMTSSLGPSGEVGAWDASGFSITTRVSTTTSNTKWVAIDLGDLDAAVVDIDAPTTTGAHSVTIGFESQFGMILGTLAPAYEAVQGTNSDVDASACAIGVATADAEFTNEVVNEDGAGTTNTASSSNNRFLIANPGDQSCSAGSCYIVSLDSFDSTDWNLDYVSVFSDTVRKWVGLAVEAPAEEPPPVSARRRIAPWGVR